MTDPDKKAIEALACADTYHCSERQAALNAYYRGLQNGELDQSPHMLFMSEVDNVCPDLMLRAMYRKKVQQAHAKAS